MSGTGLIQKLDRAKVIEKHLDELRFTDLFCKHVANYNRNHYFKKGATLPVWRRILGEFDPSLGSLPDREVATTVMLLGYFLDGLSKNKL